jgi:hypothetical protein
MREGWRSLEVQHSPRGFAPRLTFRAKSERPVVNFNKTAYIPYVYPLRTYRIFGNVQSIVPEALWVFSRRDSIGNGSGMRAGGCICGCSDDYGYYVEPQPIAG